MKEECIVYCIQHSQCNAVYVAFKNNSDLVNWCSYFKTDLLDVNIINGSDAIPLFWLSLWEEMGGHPDSSEFIITG